MKDYTVLIFDINGTFQAFKAAHEFRDQLADIGYFDPVYDPVEQCRDKAWAKYRSAWDKLWDDITD